MQRKTIVGSIAVLVVAAAIISLGAIRLMAGDANRELKEIEKIQIQKEGNAGITNENPGGNTGVGIPLNAEKELAEQMMNGDFSGMAETEYISRENVQSVYRNKGEETEWTWADINGDGSKDLILQEKEVLDIGKPVIGVFDIKNQGRCVVWDTMDATEYFFVVGNDLIYYAPYFGMFCHIPYQKYHFDEEWNPSKGEKIEAYYLYDMEEIEGVTFEDMPEEGVYFWASNGEEKSALTRDDFIRRFEWMTGADYEYLASLPDMGWLQDLDAWIGDYIYVETFPHEADEEAHYFCGYHVEIFKKNNRYYATIEGEGWQLQTQTLATVSGNEEAVRLYFEETLPEDALYGVCERYDNSDKLLTFQKKGDVLETTWHGLKQEHPVFSEEEEEVTGSYFESVGERAEAGSIAIYSYSEEKGIEDCEVDMFEGYEQLFERVSKALEEGTIESLLQEMSVPAQLLSDEEIQEITFSETRGVLELFEEDRLRGREGQKSWYLIKQNEERTDIVVRNKYQDSDAVYYYTFQCEMTKSGKLSSGIGIEGVAPDTEPLFVEYNGLQYLCVPTKRADGTIKGVAFYLYDLKNHIGAVVYFEYTDEVDMKIYAYTSGNYNPPPVYW